MRGIVYDGPSALNGDRIVAIATASSKNPKTGPMGQVWILGAALPPVESAQKGTDDAICGDCPLRRIATGRCYVQLHKAPQVIYSAWKRGSYPDLTTQLRTVGQAQRLRIGAYGDPAALPEEVVKELLAASPGWTAYTRQWQRFPWLRSYAMASCLSESEYAEATALGWRSFRVRDSLASPRLPSEIICPASVEGGQLVTCEQCGLCRGTAVTAKDIVMVMRTPTSPRYVRQPPATTHTSSVVSNVLFRSLDER